jgi:hypothetical protein
MVLVLDKLTTQADSLFREMEEEGSIQNLEELKTFLDNLTNYLESIGGACERIGYVDNRELKLMQRANKLIRGVL